MAAATRTGERTGDGGAAGGEALVEEPSGRRPITYKIRKRKRTTRGMREVQRQEESLATAAEHLSGAVADGFSEYRRRRDRSAERKRDGALKDVVRNGGRGLEEAVRGAARVPTDLTRRLSAKRLARLIVLPPPFGFLR